jgi:hypothetical protein
MLRILKGWLVISYLVFLVVAMTYSITKQNKENTLVTLYFAELFLIITLIVMVVTK